MTGYTTYTKLEIFLFKLLVVGSFEFMGVCGLHLQQIHFVYNLSVEFTGQSSKKRHTLMFSYDVGQIENISETVDSILKEWTQIVYLYAAVDQLVRYLRWDALNVR